MSSHGWKVEIRRCAGGWIVVTPNGENPITDDQFVSFEENGISADDWFFKVSEEGGILNVRIRPVSQYERNQASADIQEQDA